MTILPLTYTRDAATCPTFEGRTVEAVLTGGLSPCELDGEAKAIITDAFVFTDFKLGELPDMKFFTHVAAWDTGAEHTSLSMKVIETKNTPPTTGAASGCNVAAAALRRNDDILWARSDSPFLRGVGARLRYVFTFIY